MRSLRKNKKGIELAINFIVGLILGIIMLSLGLVFTMQMFKGASEMEKMGLPSSFDIEAQNCVQRGDRVCIPVIQMETEPNKQVSYGVVVNNIYGKKQKFKVFVEFRKAILEDETELESADITDWTLEDEGTELDNNEHVIVEVPLRPPKNTKLGTYIFSVNTCFDTSDAPSNKCSGDYDSLYSPTQQITVEVV